MFPFITASKRWDSPDLAPRCCTSFTKHRLGFPWVVKASTNKKQNKATLSDIQQIKTMSLLRKLDHSKKKSFPGPFLQKKKTLKFQVLTTHFVETNLQPRAPSFLMASSNPAEVPGTAARRTERKRSWIQLIWNFKLKFSWNSNFIYSLEFQFQQGGRVFLYKNISCTTFRARSTENQLWTKPSNSASARLVDFLPRCFCWVCLKNSRPTQVFHRVFFYTITPPKNHMENWWFGSMFLLFLSVVFSGSKC